MTFYIKDPATDRAVRRLAGIKGKTLTETIREAVEAEYRALMAKPPLKDRIRHIQERIAARPLTGKKADKAFFDALSGQ